MSTLRPDTLIPSERGYKADSEASILWWTLDESVRMDFCRRAEALNIESNKALDQARRKALEYPSNGPAGSTDPYGGAGVALFTH